MRRLGVAAAIVDGAHVPGDVGVDQGRVAAVGLPPGRRGLAVPGLVDLQVNGYAGHDFHTSDVDGWTVAAQALARDGVTAFVANLITAAEADTRAALATAADVTTRDSTGASRLLGAHLEGPFLSPERAGVHPQEQLRAPDPALLDRLLEAGPVIGMTLAPERDGALELVARLVARGVLVSLGHSDATAAHAHAGFDAGARTVTHVFNGMSTPTARAAGLAGVALTRDDVSVQVICDGVHVSRDVVRLVLQAAGPRLVLVTDALAAAAAPDGDYVMGDVRFTSRDGQARRADGTLAGSVLTMAAALRALVEAGASVEDAVAAATLRPAAVLRRGDLGRLRPGDPADLAVLDDALAVTASYPGRRSGRLTADVMEVVIVTPAEVGALAASAVAALLMRRPDAVLGLATGSSPLGVYASLADRHRRGEISFARATAFLLDEYVGLAADHPQRYRSVIAREFESRVDFPPGSVHGPDGLADDLPGACAEFEAAIAAAGGVDLQLLGIGTDGHIAFNEPGSSLRSRTRIKTLTAQTRTDNARFFSAAADVPRHVLTQGLGTISDARHCVLVATGGAKADAVRAMVQGPVSASCPASVLQLHPHVTVFLDDAAAATLAFAAYYRETYAGKPSWQGF